MIDNGDWGRVSETLVVAQAFAAVIRRDFYIFMSYRARFLTQMASALFSLTLFYYVSRLVHIQASARPAPTTPSSWSGCRC